MVFSECYPRKPLPQALGLGEQKRAACDQPVQPCGLQFPLESCTFGVRGVSTVGHKCCEEVLTSGRQQ